MGNGKYYQTKFPDYLDGYVSIHMNGVRATTPYHEIGHMVEYFNPEALRISKNFLARRTQGETLEKLKDILPGIALAVLMGGCVNLVELFHLTNIVTLLIPIPLGALIYIIASALLHLESFELDSLEYNFHLNSP